MYDKNKEITILLFFPDIQINTTSVNRYKSIIKELCFQKFNIKVISFNDTSN